MNTATWNVVNIPGAFNSIHRVIRYIWRYRAAYLVDAIIRVQRRMKMQYQVLVENLPDGQFSAFVIGVPDIVAEGVTVEDALNKARALLKERLAAGRLFTIEVEGAPAGIVANPWLETHGTLRDDATFDDWVEEIAKYRREVDGEESQP